VEDGEGRDGEGGGKVGPQAKAPQNYFPGAGAVFHPDCGGRDFPSILSDDL